MPLPLVLAGIAGASALGVSAVNSSIGRAFLKRQLSRNSEEIERWALAAVFEQLGLPDLTDGGLNKQSFTQAINDTFLQDQTFKFTNIFDATAVRNDALRAGLLQAAEQAGLQLENVSIEGMTEAIRLYVLELVQEEISADEAGDLLQDAKDIYEIIALYKRYKKAESDGEQEEGDGRKPLINTPEAASNRERQARYRANNKRVWVER